MDKLYYKPISNIDDNMLGVEMRGVLQMFTLVIDGICLLCRQNLRELIYRKNHSDRTTYQGISNITSKKEDAISKSLSCPMFLSKW